MNKPISPAVEQETVREKPLEEPEAAFGLCNPEGQIARVFDFTPWTPPFHYDDMGSYIVDSKERRVVDIRGWGFLTGKGSEALGMEETKAADIQDRFGTLIAVLLNVSSGPKETESDADSGLSQTVVEPSDGNALSLIKELANDDRIPMAVRADLDQWLFLSSHATKSDSGSEFTRHRNFTEGYCNVCSRPMQPTGDEGWMCNCCGIQPYSLSSYPGEYRLVKTHPSDDDDEQWYKRSEIDPLLSKSSLTSPLLETEREAVTPSD